MSSRIDVAGIAGNDVLLTFTLSLDNAPLSLSTYTPVVVVKASATATDESGTTYGVGTGITIVSAALGRFTLTIPHTATGTPGTTWFRCDVSNGSRVETAVFGNLVLQSA